MRQHQSTSLTTLSVCAATAFFFAASILMSSQGVLAGEAKTSRPPVGAKKAEPAPSPWSNPRFSDAKASLDDSDEVAALEALQVTLSEMGDGTTYVWHRGHGRLSGAFQATSSFKDGDGRICRHLVMILASGTYSRKHEGIACRLQGGVWQLEG